MSYHVIVQISNNSAPRFDAQKRKNSMDQTSYGANRHGAAKSECVGHVLKISFIDITKVLF